MISSKSLIWGLTMTRRSTAWLAATAILALLAGSTLASAQYGRSFGTGRVNTGPNLGPGSLGVPDVRLTNPGRIEPFNAGPTIDLGTAGRATTGTSGNSGNSTSTSRSTASGNTGISSAPFRDDPLILTPTDDMRARWHHGRAGHY